MWMCRRVSRTIAGLQSPTIEKKVPTFLLGLGTRKDCEFELLLEDLDLIQSITDSKTILR